jgi:hypothetical protein
MYKYYPAGWRKILNSLSDGDREFMADSTWSVYDVVYDLRAQIESAGDIDEMVELFTDIVTAYKRVFAKQLTPKVFTPEALAEGYEKVCEIIG